MQMHDPIAQLRDPAPLVAAQPAPALVVDPGDDRILAANAPAAALYRAEALTARRFSSLHPDGLPALIVFAEEVVERGRAWTRGVPARAADGQALRLEYEARALDGPGGPWLLFVAHDLDARARRDAQIDAETYARGGLLEWRRAQGFFREFERASRLILDAAGEGIYGVDVEGRATFANPAAERMLGWTSEEMIGRNIHALIHHTHADGARYPAEDCPIYNAFRFGKINRVEDEVFWRRDGRPIRVEYTSTPIIDHGATQGAVIVFRDITRRKENERRLREAMAEVAALKARLEMENAYLQEEVRAVGQHRGIIGASAATRRLLEQIALVGPTEASVLITGESGCGKELVAQAVHDESRRRDRALIRVNCAAVPAELFESEFFGHVKGAFTGALRDREGRFALADGGTLFLDEVGEIPLELQGTLLRVLQEGAFARVGDGAERRVDVRVIAATNRDLAAEARAGRFREDLYFRLNVFPIHCAPLRERAEDVAPLAEHFVRLSAARLGVAPPTLTRAGVAQLQAYGWPGNVRELQNVIERAAILARGGRLDFTPHLPASAPAAAPATVASAAILSEAERRRRDDAALDAALAAAGGRVSGPEGAAALLGVKPSTLYSRLRRRGRR